LSYVFHKDKGTTALYVTTKEMISVNITMIIIPELHAIFLLKNISVRNTNVYPTLLIGYKSSY